MDGSSVSATASASPGLKLAVVFAIALGCTALAFSVRNSTRTEPQVLTRGTDDLVVIGHVGRFGAGGADDAVRQGLGLWLRRVDERRGLPYSPVSAAAVRLESADATTPQTAAGAARNLLASGANILVTPTDPAMLAAVAGVARERRAVMLSPVARPTAVSPDPLHFYLSRQRLGAADGVLDVVERLARTSPRTSRNRISVGILSEAGDWGIRARRAAGLARARGYRVASVVVEDDDPRAALRQVRSDDPDVLLAQVPVSKALAWKRDFGRPQDGAWALFARDVREVLDLEPEDPVVVSVPWNPTAGGGGVWFESRAFTEDHVALTARLPSPDAAAGGAIGVVIAEGVTVARSLDMGRVAKAIGRLEVQSFWGNLRFERGEQPAASSSVILVEGAELRTVWPSPARPALLRRAVPAAAVP